MTEGGGRPQLQQVHGLLSPKERWNLAFCLLAWMFAVSNVTLVISNADVIVRSIDTSVTDRWTTVPLGLFFAGAALVSSFGYLDSIFSHEGRKFTFFIGSALSLAGTILGAMSLLFASRTLWAAATAVFGAAAGIAWQLRFAVRGVVAGTAAASYATASMVAGGIGAAVWGGPWMAGWVQRGLFLDTSTGEGADENSISYEFMGVFLLTGVYGVAGAICTALIDFGDAESVSNAAPRYTDALDVYAAMLTHPSTVFPMLYAALVWCIMLLPMCMAQAVWAAWETDDGRSLTMEELHIVCMYAPGLLISAFMCCRRFGHRVSCRVSVILSLAAVTLLLFAGEGPSLSSRALWIIGMACLGLGWGFGFIGATEWAAQARLPGISETQIHCAHDFFVFFMVCIASTAASLTVEDMDSALTNFGSWKALNGVVAILLSLTALLLVGDWLWTPEAPAKESKKPATVRRAKEQSNIMVIDRHFVVDDYIRHHGGHKHRKQSSSHRSPYSITEAKLRQHSLIDIEESADALQHAIRKEQSVAYEHDDDEEDVILHLKPMEETTTSKSIDEEIRMRSVMGIALADDSFESDSVYVDDDDDDTLPPPPPPLDGDFDEAMEFESVRAIWLQKSYWTASTADETGDSLTEYPRIDPMGRRL